MISMTTLPIVVQAAASFFQFLLTIGIFVFTLLYVIYTKKILDQHYATFVALIDVKRSGETIALNIENHGTTIALNISVILGIGSKDVNLKVPLQGPVMLMEGEKTIFRGELSPNTRDSDIFFEISYRSNTRWPRTEVWKIKDNGLLFVGKK